MDVYIHTCCIIYIHMYIYIYVYVHTCRVNAFALSPMSPLAGLPPGSTSAGLGKMTRRLTLSKSFLRDFFNVESLDRGEHGMVFLCLCVSFYVAFSLCIY